LSTRGEPVGRAETEPPAIYTGVPVGIRLGRRAARSHPHPRGTPHPDPQPLDPPGQRGPLREAPHPRRAQRGPAQRLHPPPPPRTWPAGWAPSSHPGLKTRPLNPRRRPDRNPKRGPTVSPGPFPTPPTRGYQTTPADHQPDDPAQSPSAAERFFSQAPAGL